MDYHLPDLAPFQPVQQENGLFTRPRMSIEHESGRAIRLGQPLFYHPIDHLVGH